MLIDKFTFQTDFLFYKKHTKCTSNLRSFDFPSADSSREENSDQFIQGKFVALSFVFFPSKRQLSIFFNFHLSSVHFIGVFYRQEMRFNEFSLILPR